MALRGVVFIKGQAGPANVGDPPSKFTVQYLDPDGNMVIKSGGSRAWRCNNPGALLASPYSMGKDRRAIGRAGDSNHTYAVCPDYDTGHEALVVMLRGSRYRRLTLAEASKRYVEEDSDHLSKIIKLTHGRLKTTRTIESLSDAEFDLYWQAIERNESWQVGREDFIEKWVIAGVHKRQGRLSSTWCSEGESGFGLPKLRQSAGWVNTD